MQNQTALNSKRIALNIKADSSTSAPFIFMYSEMYAFCSALNLLNIIIYVLVGKLNVKYYTEYVCVFNNGNNSDEIMLASKPLLRADVSTYLLFSVGVENLWGKLLSSILCIRFAQEGIKIRWEKNFSFLRKNSNKTKQRWRKCNKLINIYNFYDILEISIIIAQRKYFELVHKLQFKLCNDKI